jgi:hypothetical protein
MANTSFARQRQAARGAVKQACTQPLLKRVDIAGDRRLGHFQGIRGTDETAFVDDRAEHLHF